jgi:hypothetical protein
MDELFPVALVPKEGNASHTLSSPVVSVKRIMPLEIKARGYFCPGTLFPLTPVEGCSNGFGWCFFVSPALKGWANEKLPKLLRHHYRGERRFRFSLLAGKSDKFAQSASINASSFGEGRFNKAPRAERRLPGG